MTIFLFFQELFKIFGVRDFDLPVYIKHWFAALTCDHSLGDDICANVVFLLCGFDKAQLNKVNYSTLIYPTYPKLSSFSNYKLNPALYLSLRLECPSTRLKFLPEHR